MELSRRKGGRIAAIIVGVGVLIAFFSSQDDSPAVDEVPHIGAGYSYVRRLDMRLNPEHPPLVKDLAGLALLPVGLSDAAFSQPPWTTDVNGQWNFGRAIIYSSGVNSDTVKTVARLPMLGIYVLICWMVGKWTRQRYGDSAALLAIVLIAFSPTVLAHARLVTTDAAAAAGVLVASYFFVRMLRAPDRASFLWAALTLGLALLAKFNTVLLAPFFALVALLYSLEGFWFSVKRWRSALRTLGLTALMGLSAFVFVVWPVYIAHTWNYPPERQKHDTLVITSGYNGTLKDIAVWASDKPVIRAAGHWVLGLAMVESRNAGGNTIFWLGRVVSQGGPLYFPTVYFIKEPLAWWVLVAAAITALAFHRRRHAGEPKRGTWWARNTEEWVWLLWLAIYWIVSLKSTLNIGVRHLLPVYPFTIMLVAGRISVLAAWLHRKDRARWRLFTGAVTVLVAFYVFSVLRVYPLFLTYFNELAGGPSGGYRYVVDSNLDWGQDAKRLATFVHEENIQHICVDYFGWADVGGYIGAPYQWTSNPPWRSAQDFLTNSTCDGWIAVSATFLQNSIGQKSPANTSINSVDYRWLLDYPPVTVVGNSIFVWHIEK